MSIKTEFINFIVPIGTIRTKYPGGWEQCLFDHSHLLQGRCWHDDYLFRNGAMNPIDIQSLAEDWKEMGFVMTKEVNGQIQWADFCVYEGLFGSAFECDWLVDTPDGAVAHISDPHPEITKHLPARGNF